MMDLRKLDALVAEHVMGWSDVYQQEGYEPNVPSIRDPSITTEEYNIRRKFKSIIPNYSTDISAAWEVKEKIYELGLWNKFLENLHSFAARQVDLTYQKNTDIWEEITPLDICIAAVKTMGVAVKL